MADGMRQQRILVFAWLNVLFAIFIGISWNLIGFVIGLLVIASIVKKNEDLHASIVTFFFLIASFSIILMTNGAMESYLYVLLIAAMVGLYNMLSPQIIAIAGTFIFSMYSAFFQPHIMGDFISSPVLSGVVYAGFVASIVIVSRIHTRTFMKLISRYEQMSHALDNTSSLVRHESKRADYAESRRDEFFATIIHELKTPLAVIQGNCEQIIHYWDALEDNRKWELIQRTIHGTIQLNVAIEKGLEIVRANINGWQANTETINDLPHQLQSIVDEMSTAYNVQCNVDTELSCVLEVDRRILKTILEHLIDNAHKHGYSDRPITVEARKERRRVDIIVSGWGSAKKDRITEDFFRRGMRSKHSKGSGFGLWIIKNYTKSLRGELSVYQIDCGKEDRRTEITLSLPVTTRSENDAHSIVGG